MIIISMSFQKLAAKWWQHERPTNKLMIKTKVIAIAVISIWSKFYLGLSALTLGGGLQAGLWWGHTPSQHNHEDCRRWRLSLSTFNCNHHGFKRPVLVKTFLLVMIITMVGLTFLVKIMITIITIIIIIIIILLLLMIIMVVGLMSSAPVNFDACFVLNSTLLPRTVQRRTMLHKCSGWLLFVMVRYGWVVDSSER